MSTFISSLGALHLFKKRKAAKRKLNGHVLIHESRILPMLQPLSEATGDLLEPLHVYPSDRLIIDLDDEGRRFDITIATAKRNGTIDDGLAPSGGALLLLKRIPESHKHEDKKAFHWLCGGTDTTALVIYHAWPQDQIIFKSEEAKLMYDYLLHRFLVQSRNSSLIANFKIEKTEPLMPPDFVDHPDLPLAPHQKLAMLCALQVDAFGAFMEQGTGKTPTCVALTSLLAKRQFKRQRESSAPHAMLRVLIVCPRQVRANWCNEFRRFSTVPGKTTVMRGGQIGRTKSVVAALRQEEDCIFTAVVCSYESVERTWDAISMVPWDLCILDESHKIKNQLTKRFKTLRNLRDLCRKRLILTGTPISNSPMDLWTQFEFLGDGLSGFTTHENFRKFYGTWKRDSDCHGVEKLTSIQNVPLLQERLARLTYMVTKKEAGLNLPDIVEDIVEVTMTKKQIELYVKLRDQLAVEIEEALNDDGDPTARQLTAENILTRLLRLAQITSGFVKYDDVYDPMTGAKLRTGDCENIESTLLAIPKVKALLDILQDEDRDPKAKTIVWTCFQQDRANVRQALTDAGINHRVYYGNDKDRDQAVADFNNDPSCMVILCSAKMAGEGLNLLGYDYDTQPEPLLDTNADLAVFYSENWSVIERGQAISRCHRRGTRGNIRIATLVAPGTIDQEIYDRLSKKMEMANLIQDVRAILQRIMDADPMMAIED